MKCKWCGSPVVEKPTNRPGRQKLYCSTRCRSKAREGRIRGRFAPLAPRDCLVCGAEFQPRQANHSCCTPKCNRKLNNETRRGERGNSAYYRVLFILERGGACERCGGSDNLQVHHVVPVAQGGLHVPSNVLVLCMGCHRSEHPTAVARSPEVPRETYAPPEEPTKRLLAIRKLEREPHKDGCRCLTCERAKGGVL